MYCALRGDSVDDSGSVPPLPLAFRMCPLNLSVPWYIVSAGHTLDWHVGMAEAQVKAMIAAKDIVVFAWASAPKCLPLRRVHMP